VHKEMELLMTTKRIWMQATANDR